MSSSMNAIITESYSEPSGYKIATLPRPTISDPSELIIQVHAAGVNPIDVKKAAGALKAALKDEFPYQIGYDCAGVVTTVGDQVTKFKTGDAVYVRLPESHRGSWSEYVKCPESFVALIPSQLSTVEAASLPLAAMTALQALRKYKGSLAGKTVFVPAGLSGTGSFACQLAKNHFHAGKVITTVSTAKVSKVPELLGRGVVDEIIDYTKNDPTSVIPRGSVDFILDTTGQAMAFLSLMVPSTSLIISISTQPSGTQLQQSSVMRRSDNPQIPFLARTFLNLLDLVRKTRARRWGVEYEYMFLDTNGKDLETLSECVAMGQLVPVVGSVVDFQDITQVREACGAVFSGRGSVGKTVIEIMKP